MRTRSPAARSFGSTSADTRPHIEPGSSARLDSHRAVRATRLIVDRVHSRERPYGLFSSTVGKDQRNYHADVPRLFLPVINKTEPSRSDTWRLLITSSGGTDVTDGAGRSDTRIDR
jgi:hypothetical protein